MNGYLPKLYGIHGLKAIEEILAELLGGGL
jgi:hypothetical protein